MTEVISVRFRGGCKTYYFSPGDLRVAMGDQVVVETANGPEFATCTQGNHEVADTAIVSPLSPVLRLATAADRRTAENNRKKESEAFDICEKKIADHGLDMKLVNVSASFDGSKIIFFFTADGRVDFRELVRDLAGVFRARIELRQIGVRDETKMIGGLGICGRPFCCSQFLDSFMPVSIKMAKTQNLSLNPTKISGACGRLMCCLKYEQNAYEDAIKRLPKPESFVQTPDGPGNVKAVDLLRETVKVSLDSSPEAQKKYRGCEIRILRNGKGSRDGIEIGDRTARYVEEKEEEIIAPPLLSTPFQMDPELENALTREKMGVEGGETGKPRRRHRGGRRRSGKGGSEAAAQEKTPQQQAEKQAGEKKQAEKKGADKRVNEKKGAENKKSAEKKGSDNKKPNDNKKRPEKKAGEQRPNERKKENAPEKKAQNPAPRPQKQPAAEGGEEKKHRSRHRGGRRHRGGGGSGKPQASE